MLNSNTFWEQLVLQLLSGFTFLESVELLPVKFARKKQEK